MSPFRPPAQLLPRRRFLGALLVVVLATLTLGGVVTVISEVRRLNEALSPRAIARLAAVDDLATLTRELQQAEIEVGRWQNGMSSSWELVGLHVAAARRLHAEIETHRRDVEGVFSPELGPLFDRLARQVSTLGEQYEMLPISVERAFSEGVVRRLATELASAGETARLLHANQSRAQGVVLQGAGTIAASTRWTLSWVAVLVALLGGALYALGRLSTRAIRLANERFRLAASALDGAVFDIDLERRRIVWSEGLEEVFGYGHAEGTRDLDWWLARMHSDDIRDVRRRVLPALREGGDITVEARFLDVRGEYRFVELIARVFPREGERGGRIVGSLVDLTERRRAEDAAKMARHQLESVIDHAPIVVFATDRDHRFRFCQGRGLASLGVDASYFAGKRLEELYPGRDDISGNIDRALAGESFSTLIPMGDKTFDCWYAPSRRPDGTIDGIVGVATDISERHVAQAALRELEDKYRQMVQGTQAIVFSSDLRGRVVFINEAAARALRIEPKEAVGRYYLRFVHPADRDRIHAMYRDQIIRGTPTIELEFRTLPGPDGEPLWISCTSDLMIDHRTGRGVISSIGLNVTQRQRAERLQRVMTRISEAASEKDDFGELCESIRSSLHEVIDVTNFNIALYNQRSGTIEFPYRRGEDQAEPIPSPRQLAESLTAHVLRTGEPLLADRARLEELRRAHVIKSLGRPAVWWLGVPLATGGRVIGVMILQSFSPATHFSERDVEILMFASGHIARAIERNQARESLRAIVEGTSAVTGEDFFLRLVRELSSALQVRFAFIGELVGDDPETQAPDQVRTLAVWSGDGYSPNFEYALAGTPCANVMNGAVCVIPRGVVTSFPEDQILRDMRAEAYVGLPLRDVSGRVIGLLAVVHDTALQDPSYVQSILRVFASRAGAEMERKRAEEALTYQAFHDGLTTLPNRALFMDRLEQAVARSRRRGTSCAVLFLDLDRFKFINDSLGHAYGDKLIVSIGQRLLTCVRDDDTVARLGGDEFTVLLEDLTETFTATQIAERILEELQRPFSLGGHDVYVTGSIGIAFNHEGEERSDDLLRDADAAMYRAKARGKNCFEVFDTGMHVKVRELMKLESELRRATERGEFRIYYQPKVFLETGRLEGMEALVRWQHPERGLLKPEAFIPLAEETGLIVAIDRWVLRESCRQARAWNERYRRDPPLVLSANISARQFQRADVVEHVASVLEETGLDPDCLKLEITESVAMENAEATIRTLTALKDLGVRIEIDDFGTGYSSLLYLSRFPVDTVKIDRSFIQGLADNPQHRSIVNAIIQLAHNLGIGVTAEGVESDDQIAFLRQLRCEHGQGYLFSRPVADDEAESLLAANASW